MYPVVKQKIQYWTMIKDDVASLCLRCYIIDNLVWRVCGTWNCLAGGYLEKGGRYDALKYVDHWMTSTNMEISDEKNHKKILFEPYLSCTTNTISNIGDY